MVAFRPCSSVPQGVETSHYPPEVILKNENQWTTDVVPRFFRESDFAFFPSPLVQEQWYLG